MIKTNIDKDSQLRLIQVNLNIWISKIHWMFILIFYFYDHNLLRGVLIIKFKHNFV